MAVCSYLVYGKTGFTLSGLLGGYESAYCTNLGNPGKKEPIPGKSGKTGVKMRTLQSKNEYCNEEGIAGKTCIHRNVKKMNNF